MRVADLKKTPSGTQISSDYVVTNIDLRKFKNKDGHFLNCELTDKTGTVKGIVWERAEAWKKLLEEGSVYRVVGKSSVYIDMPQVEVKSFEESTDYDRKDFVPSLEQEEIDSYFKGLEDISKTVKHKGYSKLWTYILTNQDLSKALRVCPGGVGEVHHNYLGGLLQHVSTMIQVAETAGLTHNLDRDLILTGILIHDIGKILSYNWDTVIEMSDRGRLLKHVPLGFGLLSKIGEGLKLENEDLWKLLHIVVSHHDDNIKPMFPEAEVISQIDGLDALVNHSQNWINNPDNRENTSWTKFCRLTGKRYYSPVVSGVKQEKKIETESIF